ncbi:MAG: glycosyltransferase family 2 protein [Phycisphaerae bacterium]|nr:glycosyltransferase family 2 protein [Phycisphaerae bacterium]
MPMTFTPPQPACTCNEARSTPIENRITLTIVLPALNEEEAIGRTLERCLAARETIIAGGKVTDVQLVVVSDGSTDRTAAIARGYPDVLVIEFEKNRGYGAAIKEGWRQAGGDLLAFLDADGTCDPAYFLPMCNVALDEQVDIVLGCRMGADSKMPLVRRAGNRIFASILGLLSRRRVDDTASGMRVIRADSLPRLLPLPNGLDFTPSMSARALMDTELRIREIPMKYEERIGRSKLKVFQDGLRFTREILSAAVYVRTSRVTLPIVGVLALIAASLSLFPVRHYLANGTLPEWLIYRFLTILLLGLAGVTLLCATVVAEHVIALSQLRYDRFLDKAHLWWGRRALRVYWKLGLIAVALAIILVWPGIVSYARTGEIAPTTLHWSRVVVAAFFVLAFCQMAATACLLRIIPAMHDRQRLLMSDSDHGV